MRWGGQYSDVDLIKEVIQYIPSATFMVEITPTDVNKCADDISVCNSILSPYNPYKNNIKYVSNCNMIVLFDSKKKNKKTTATVSIAFLQIFRNLYNTCITENC